MLMSAGRSNVVVIVLDDVGFAQFGCYGSSIETPSIDRLASEGLRYTNFHTTGVCSSTRASIMVGRNHHAVGIGTVIDFSNGTPGYTGRLPRDARTLAEVLREEGYATFCVGKWHLAAPGEQTAAGPFGSWPLGRGFDRYYGFLGGATSQWEPELWEDNGPIAPPRSPAEGYHLSEDLVDQAIAMLTDDRDAGAASPFFLWLAFGAGHDPHHVAAEYIARYRGRFDDGWDVERERVFDRQLTEEIVPPHTVLPPLNPGTHRWSDLDSDSRRVFARMQEVFAGFITHTDLQIGRLVDHLRDTGELDNTLVIVVSDNGASAEGGADGLVGNVSPMYVVRLLTEAAQTGEVPNRLVAPMLFDNEGYPVYVAEQVSDMIEHLDEMGGPGTHGHYPQGWATAGNTPFRHYKGNMHYGGTRDPLVVRFPSAIPDPGGLRSQFHHAIDLYPTILAAAGVEATPDHTGTRRLDGVDMTYSVSDADAPSTRTTQYFAMYGHRGIYHDGWKAVTFHNRGADFDLDEWELYDITSDPSEANNLASKHPQRVRELVDRWYDEADRNQVLPLDDYPFLDIRFSPGPRSLYAYPEVQAIAGRVRPDLFTTSFRVTADIRIEGGSQGVLVANGIHGAGQVLYILDGHLIFEWHGAGHRVDLATDQRLPTGEITVGVALDRSRGELSLFVDDTTVALTRASQLPDTPTLGTMDLGRDPDPQVSDAYTGSFDFDGTIKRVRVVTDDGEAFDADGEQILETAMLEQ
jgi:arylsulfatase A-like enzyme